MAVNATILANAILGQRQDIARARRLATGLLDELEAQSFEREHFRQLDLLLRKAMATGKVAAKEVAGLLRVYERVTTTESRIESAKKLAETMKVLIELERKVLNISGDIPDDPTARVAEAVASGFDELKRRFQAKTGKAV